MTFAGDTALLWRLRLGDHLVDPRAFATDVSRPGTSDPTPAQDKQMAKIPLCAVLRSVILVASLSGISTIAVAQHSAHDHAAPSGVTAAAPRDQILAQASPQAPQQQPAPSAMPGMSMTGGGDMHAPVIITLRSGIAAGRMVYIGVGG